MIVKIELILTPAEADAFLQFLRRILPAHVAYTGADAKAVESASEKLRAAIVKAQTKQ